MPSKEKIISLSNIYEASFCLASGINLLGIEETGGGYYCFQFQNCSKLQKAIEDYNSNLTIPVLSFTSAFQRLKGLVFREKNAIRNK